MTIRRRAFLTAAVGFFLCVLVTHGAVAADAAAFIRDAGDRTIKTFSGDLSEDEREKRFRGILSETFDLPVIGRFVLGRYWRLASEKQRTEYLALFEDFIVQAYSHRFKDITGTKLEVTQSRALNNRDTWVLSEIVSAPDKPVVRVNWRVRAKSSRFKVIDVVVEGVSMVVTQRDEFAAVIRSSGGKVDGLLRALRKKTGN